MESNKLKPINIPGWPAIYACNDQGQVFHLIKKREIKPSVSKDGFAVFCAKYSSQQKIISVHRAVANCYIDNPAPEKLRQVLHKNGNRLDNRAENLYWGQREYLTLAEVSDKLITSGRAAGRKRRRLTDLQVNTIRSYYARKFTQEQIAKMLGVHRSCVQAVISGRSYSDVVAPEPPAPIQVKEFNQVLYTQD